MYAEKVLTGSVIDYQEGYHRIQVISMVKDIIWVNFFDFGTVGVVRKDQLRVLLKKCLELCPVRPLSAACGGWRTGWA
jgi:hypothetical protein